MEITLAYIKADSDQEQVYFDYLEELRQSGATNMYGASPYLACEFMLEDKEAGNILVKWIKYHSDPSRIIKD